MYTLSCWLVSNTEYFPWRQNMESKLFVHQYEQCDYTLQRSATAMEWRTIETTQPRIVALRRLLGEFLLYRPTYFIHRPRQYVHFTAHFNSIRVSWVTGGSKILVLVSKPNHAIAYVSLHVRVRQPLVPEPDVIT